MKKSERLNELYKKYNLDSEDIFKSPQGWKIITRSGIDKVQSIANIDIKYTHVIVERGFVVIKATGTMGDQTIETYGEADMGGAHGKGNCRQNYPVAMSEKRAMSRVVLKLAGFYELGVYSEDESDDFAAVKKSERKPLLKDTL